MRRNSSPMVRSCSESMRAHYVAAESMRDHYVSLGFVETTPGTWKLPQKKLLPATPIKKASRRKTRTTLTVDAICSKLGSTNLSGSCGKREPLACGHTLSDLRRSIASSHDLSAALASFSMDESVGQRSTCNSQFGVVDGNMAADQLMEGLAPGSWREYMELRVATKVQL